MSVLVLDAENSRIKAKTPDLTLEKVMYYISSRAN